jgi:hypothetical protein
MATRKSPLADTLEALGGGRAITPLSQPPAPAVAPSSPSGAEESGKYRKPDSRAGMVYTGAWLPRAYQDSIVLAKLKTRLLPRDIVAQALNQWFVAHGLPALDMPGPGEQG